MELRSGKALKLYNGDDYMIIDKDLEYDKNTGRYSLSESFVFNEMGTSLEKVLNTELDTNISTQAKRTIKYASDMLYDWIENNAYSKKSTLYHFTRDEEANQALKRALSYQLNQLLLAGDMSYETGRKAWETINARAVQTLEACNCLEQYYINIPDKKEW